MYKYEQLNMLLILITLFLTTDLTAQTAENTVISDEDAVAIEKVILTSYIDGLQNDGDTTKIDAGFHPTFRLIGKTENGQIRERTITEWRTNQIAKKERGELPLTGDNRISGTVDLVDITGDAAVARLQYYVGDEHRFTDYLSLYRFDDGWKIIAKIFQEL